MSNKDTNHISADRIYDAILHRIASGNLRAGMRLIEQDLAKEYEVSRSPVREALIRLSEKGIIEIIANRGAFVSDLSQEKMSEVLVMRAGLEGLAARFAATHNGGFILKTLSGIAKRMEVAARNDNLPLLFEYHWQFHETICNASENEMLLNSWERYYTIMHMMLQSLIKSERSGGTLESQIPVKKILSGTNEILRAIAEGDPDEAEDVLRNSLIFIGFEMFGLPVPHAFPKTKSASAE